MSVFKDRISKSSKTKENQGYQSGSDAYETNFPTVVILISENSKKLEKFGLQVFKKKQNERFPGPADYSPNYAYNTKNDPSIRFNRATEARISLKSPGPAEYSQEKKRKIKSGTIGN